MRKFLNIYFEKDMEWLVDHGGPTTSLEVDIGYMPRMELRSAAPSINMNGTGVTTEQFISAMSDKLYESVLKPFDTIDENFHNEEEIYNILEKQFFPFKEVFN